jgi:hypothetical protein
VTKFLRPLSWFSWVCVLVLGVCLAAGRTAAAQNERPVAVLSFASIDQLLSDFGYLTRVGGRSDVGGFIQMAGANFVADLDRTKPLGLIVTMENDEPKGVAFLCVPDPSKLLRLVRERLNAEVEEVGGGVQKLDLGEGVYLRQQGEWLFISDQARHLAHLPADPVALLGGLEKKYSVAARLNVQNIPSGLRDLGLFQLHAKIDQDMRNVRLEDPELDGPFMESTKKGFKQIANMLVQQSDQITFGWGVDAQDRHTFVDLQVTALPGSALARLASSLSSGQADLTGFEADGAAVTLVGATQLAAGDTAPLRTLVDYLRKKSQKGLERDPQTPAALKDIVDQVLQVVDKTVEEGKAGAGASVMLAPKSLKFVAALHVADGRALAKAFQDLFELARQQPSMPDVKFFADKAGDIDLHKFTVPISDSDEDARKILGDKLDVVVGTGPHCLYFAFGESSDQLLKKVAEASAAAGSQSLPPARLHVAVRPLVAFLASLESKDDKLKKMAEAMEAASGGDTISLGVSPLENGLGCRLVIEEGVLEMLGKSAAASGLGD